MTDLEKAAREAAGIYGRKTALPEIRSMYPSESRGVMANHFAQAFLAGARFGREQMLAECLGLLRSWEGKSTGAMIDSNAWADWLEKRMKK